MGTAEEIGLKLQFDVEETIFVAVGNDVDDTKSTLVSMGRIFVYFMFISLPMKLLLRTSENNPEYNNSEISSSSQSSQAVNPGNKISTVKLSDENFLLWKFQILTALEGHDLDQHINEDCEPPPEKIQVSENGTMISKPNPAFKLWKKQDKLVSSWIVGSMSESILEQILHCKSAKEIWSCLLQIFNSRHLAQIMKIKSKLQNIQKGGSSMSEYISKIKKCVDALSAIGKEVDVQDHIMYILSGLGAEYETMVYVITAKTGTQTVHDVVALLLTHESRIESKSAVNPDNVLPSANLVVQNPVQNTVQNSSQNVQQQNFGNNRGRGRSNFGQNRGGRTWNNRNRPQCQICNKFGHTAIKCYSRVPMPSAYATQFSPSGSGFLSGQNFGQQQFGGPFPQMQAMMATPNYNQDCNWYPDSGATNHLTNSLSNMSVSSEYPGNNQVLIGNGAGSSN